jgi:hypothetical protein
MPAPESRAAPRGTKERPTDATSSPARRLSIKRRRSLPWSERSILVASLLMVALLSPLWLDPLTLQGLLGMGGPRGSATPAGTDRSRPATAEPLPSGARVAASDTFSRREGAGWGSADVGGSYLLSGAADLSVQPGVGIVELAAAGEGEALLGVSARDVGVEFSVALDGPPAGGELELRVVLRASDGRSALLPAVRIGPEGSLTARVTALAGGASDTLVARVAVPDVTVTGGAVLRVRAEAVGSDPTTIRLRVWPASRPEPAFWHVSVIDWTGSLQDAGMAGLGWRAGAGATSITLRYDDLVIETTDGGTP